MVSSVLIKLLYGQPEHKIEPSESPWTIQELPHSTMPRDMSQTPWKQKRKEDEDSYLKEDHYLFHPMGILALNLGYTLNHVGVFFKNPDPRLHPNQLNQDLVEMGLKE